MAIKENTADNNYAYSIPIKTPLSLDNGRQNPVVNAKKIFFNKTVNETDKKQPNLSKKSDSKLHYAQIDVSEKSKDTRSTGGGKKVYPLKNSLQSSNQIVEFSPKTSSNLVKRFEPQPRKVSFKTRNTSMTYKRPHIISKTAITVNGSKVSELTKKFNDLVRTPQRLENNKIGLQLDGVQSIALASNNSNNSSNSSTLSKGSNFKIIVRQRKNSKKRLVRQRCSSADSIDTLISANHKANKVLVIRSKSDGNKIPKSPKKQSIRTPKEYTKKIIPEETRIKLKNSKSDSERTNSVRNVIKKFENEICAQSEANIKSKILTDVKCLVSKDKPQVPEKKVSLAVTKNVVVRDGMPKLKITKTTETLTKNNKNIKEPTENKSMKNEKKDSLYSSSKLKTNYIHSDKFNFHIVDIIPEDTDELKTVQIITNDSDCTAENKSKQTEKIYEEIDSLISPNESFLWRRKSSTQIYSDSEKSFSDSLQSLQNILPKESNVEHSEICAEEHSNKVGYAESDHSYTSHSTVDLNNTSNLVETYNAEVRLISNGTEQGISNENIYEPLYTKRSENISVITIKTVDRPPKKNCPLPEIPKDTDNSSNYFPCGKKENIYQCLLEMRSHPEGDESTNNYEFCDTQLEERTRGDGDSDDGYEYCKTAIKPYCIASDTGIQIAEDYRPESKNYSITKSVSNTSTVSYEKIGSERIYEKIPAKPDKHTRSDQSNRHSLVSDCTSYNDGENIYDTIKQNDNLSLSHCYESIPNSPSIVKLRKNIKNPGVIGKRLSFDTMSNVSQSTMSSEQKTNSIYGQRSVVSYNGQEMPFLAPNSETSSSKGSDEWVDVSDEDKEDEQKIIIVTERSRGRKSPVSWSQKVRHQWQKSPKPKNDYDGDSSDSGHLYETLEAPPAPPPPLTHLNDSFDSFDSDTDTDEDAEISRETPPALPSARLPALPGSAGLGGGGPYTLTKIANAAQRKMRELKRNLTKRYSVAMDSRSFKTGTSMTTPNTETKTKLRSSIYANLQSNPVYSNIVDNDLNTEKPNKLFTEELKTVIKEKANDDIPDKPLPDKPTTPNDSKKDSGTLSRKTYLSFKSRFRRASSVAVDINRDVPGALKITNSTFYLTDSMDGDSGFSNCSDSTPTNGVGAPNVPNGGRLRTPCAGSTPCLALERPAVPPPPPPTAPRPDIAAVQDELKRLLPTLSRKERPPRSRTSWYADTKLNNSSWYAEAGVCQAGNVSSSSGASSASRPPSPPPTPPATLLSMEPLYQFYNAAKVESVRRTVLDSDSETYEAAGSCITASNVDELGKAKPQTLSAPSSAAPAPRSPARTLWCELPEVVSSGLLAGMSLTERRLMEAKFELITSEASYLNSLDVLLGHLASHPALRDPRALTPEEWDTLFSPLLPVRRCSRRLLAALEQCRRSERLAGACEAVCSHAAAHFHVYVTYCRQQPVIVRTLQRLRERPAFAAALRTVESSPECQALPLHSFLLLPLQRATRLPLLLDAVLRHTPPGDAERDACERALHVLNTVVSECNEAARNTERIEEMWRLSSAILFPERADAVPPPVIGPALYRRDRRAVRWLVKSGEMTYMEWRGDEARRTFGRKYHKVPLHLFLFNDLLVIAKKKGEERFVATDYCARALVEAREGAAGAGPAGVRHALLLTLLEDCEGRTREMLMSCPSETEACRWLEALRTGSSPGGGHAAGTAGDAGEAVYAGWDCPQVAAVFPYDAAQQDELRLVEGDVINVTRKTAEGWYYGERTRDGEAGWFPGAFTVEVESAHARARHLRQKYRLLALSNQFRGKP